MKRIDLFYQANNDTPEQKTLQGQRVGYGFNPPEEDESVFRIWADDVTFGVPFKRVISFEVTERVSGSA